MNIRRFISSAFVAFLVLTPLFLSPPAAAQEVDDAEQDYVILDDVIAWVGSEYITQSEYDFEKMRQRKMLEQSQLTAEQQQKALVDFDRKVFESMVERLLVLHAGKAAGLRVPDYEMDLFLDNFIQQNEGINSLEELDEALKRFGSNLDSFKRESRQGLMMEKVRKQLIWTRIKITEEEIRETYMAHQDDFLVPAWVRLEEIVLNATDYNRERVEEILAELRSGQRSFSDTARLISSGSSADEGGDLGSFPLDDLSDSLRQLVEGLEKGEVSDPVEIAAGLQIIRVAEKESATFKPLLDVEDVIRDVLLRERQVDEQVAFVDELREKAYIKIYPEELQ